MRRRNRKVHVWTSAHAGPASFSKTRSWICRLRPSSRQIQATCQRQRKREKSWRLGQLAVPGSCSGGVAFHQSDAQDGLRARMPDARGTCWPVATYLACCQWKLSIGVFDEPERGGMNLLLHSLVWRSSSNRPGDTQTDQIRSDTNT